MLHELLRNYCSYKQRSTTQLNDLARIQQTTKQKTEKKKKPTATTASGSCKLFHCFGQKDSLSFNLRSKTKNYVLMNHISLRQPNVDIILKEVVPDPKSTTIVLKKASSKTKK